MPFCFVERDRAQRLQEKKAENTFEHFAAHRLTRVRRLLSKNGEKNHNHSLNEAFCAALQPTNPQERCLKSLNVLGRFV
jgi:hypothetical protein